MDIRWITTYFVVFYIFTLTDFEKVSYENAFHTSKHRTCTPGQKEREHEGTTICCNTEMCIATFQPCHKNGGSDVCMSCEDGYCSQNAIPYNTTYFDFPPNFACEKIKTFCDDEGGTKPVFNKETGCVERCECQDGYYGINYQAKDCKKADDPCHREGQELSDQGKCVDCPKEKFKNFTVGECIPKTVCGSNQITIDNGSTKTDTICEYMAGQDPTKDSKIRGPGISNDTEINNSYSVTENVTFKYQNETRRNVTNTSEAGAKSSQYWIVQVVVVGTTLLLIIIVVVTFRLCTDGAQRQKIYEYFVEKVCCCGCVKSKEKTHQERGDEYEVRKEPTESDHFLERTHSNDVGLDSSEPISRSNSARNVKQQTNDNHLTSISSILDDNYENISHKSNGHCVSIPLTSVEPLKCLPLTRSDSTKRSLTEDPCLTSDHQNRTPSTSSINTEIVPSNKYSQNISVTANINITVNTNGKGEGVKTKDVNINLKTADSPVHEQKKMFSDNRDILDCGQPSHTDNSTSLTNAGCTAAPFQEQNIGIALPIKLQRPPSPQENSSNIRVQQPVQDVMNTALVLNGGLSIHSGNTDSEELPSPVNDGINSLGLPSAPDLTCISGMRRAGVVNTTNTTVRENGSGILNLDHAPQVFPSSDSSILTDVLYNEPLYGNGEMDNEESMDQTAVKAVV